MDTKTYLRLPRERNRPETRTGGRGLRRRFFYGGGGYERGKREEGREKREERRDKGYGMRELKILPKYKLYDIKIGGRGVYNGIRDIVIFWKNI